MGSFFPRFGVRIYGVVNRLEYGEQTHCLLLICLVRKPSRSRSDELYLYPKPADFVRIFEPVRRFCTCWMGEERDC